MERPEKSCKEGGVLGGHPGAGDVACSLRNTRTAKLHSFYSRQLGMLHATHHFAVTETCLPVDTAGYSLTGEQNTYRDGEVE